MWRTQRWESFELSLWFPICEGTWFIASSWETCIRIGKSLFQIFSLKVIYNICIYCIDGCYDSFICFAAWWLAFCQNPKLVSNNKWKRVLYRDSVWHIAGTSSASKTSPLAHTHTHIHKYIYIYVYMKLNINYWYSLYL